MPPFTDPNAVLALTRDADANGWDAVFLWDHLRWGPDDLDIHDAWVLLGAIASRTSRVRIGTMITPLARRRPWVVAKHLTTLDHLSGGRVTLGVGLGEPPDRDFADLGDDPSPTVRGARLDEGLAILGGLLGDGHVSFHGTHYDVEAGMRPLPVQRPRIPIWVGGKAPHKRPLERARRWDGFIRPTTTSSPPSSSRPTSDRTHMTTGTSSRSGLTTPLRTTTPPSAPPGC